MQTGLKLIPFSLAVGVVCLAQSARPSASEVPELVRRALAAELRAAEDTTHPMRYQLLKASPRLTTTKEIVETVDGGVAMLLSVNGEPPSAADLRKEQSRLDDLLANPGKQSHRKQQQEEDRARALKVLSALPTAFEYVDAGVVATGNGNAERFVFSPKPGYHPQDLETVVLTAMNGEMWIDPRKGRVLRLQAQLQRDVDFGWGVLGRLYKGGWITIDQAEVQEGVWRIVKFQMSMSARVLIRTKNFQTTEEESHFEPVPADLDYREAIRMLQSMGPGALAQVR